MDQLEVMDNKKMVSVDDLPEVVFEYILSQLSPYRQLDDCKLVSKWWRFCVRETIAKLKRDLVYCLSNQLIQWSHYSVQSGPSISARYSHSTCCVDDSMYVFGGCTIANTTFNDLWRFDLSTRTWIRPIATGTFPSPKACASLVAYNNNLVLFGGWTHSSPYPIHQEWRIFNHIHIFDTIADRWSLIVPNSESPAIAGHSASIVGHHMIVFGGLRSEANNPLPFSSNNDIWVLDLKSFVWRKQITSNPKPLPRYGHSQVVIDDRHILIIGGSGGPNMLFSDIWMLCISEDTKQMSWKPIEVLNKDSSNTPQISFHPTCKVENLLVVLSQKVRPFQCKDGNILRKPSVRSQYVNTNDSNSKSSLNVKLESQSNAVSIASTSSASTSQQSQTNGNTSLRPLSRRNRQRQLEGLDRMEQRIRQLKSHTFSPLAVRSGTVRSDRESAQNPMQLFVLDLSDVIEKNVVNWIHKNHFINDGPEEVILYSLVAGRAEIIMFGGLQKDKNMKQNQTESGVNNIPDIVSNQLHIITAISSVI